MIQEEFRIFLAAIIFFTRIPCQTWETPSRKHFNQASRYFPLIGWIVGAIAVFVFWSGSRVFPLPLTVWLSMTATIMLTGALHEDGFADVCDGFGGGWTKEQILTIMKDSAVGAFGVTGLVLILGIKFLSLIALPSSLLPMALVSGHSLSRFASISLMYTHDYVREDAHSKAKSVVRRMSRGGLIFAGFWGIVPCIAMMLMFSQTTFFVVSIGAVWLIRWGLGRYFIHWIGGYTGDCLGAVQQVSEVIFYLSLVATT